MRFFFGFLDLLTTFTFFWFLVFLLTFLIYFWIFFLSFWFLWIFFGLKKLDFWEFFGFFLDFFVFFVFVCFKVTKVNTKCYHGYFSTPKITKNGPKQHKKLFFCPKGKKSLGRRPKPSAGARSRPKYRPIFSSDFKNWFTKKSCLKLSFF